MKCTTFCQNKNELYIKCKKIHFFWPDAAFLNSLKTSKSQNFAYYFMGSRDTSLCQNDFKKMETI